MNCEKIYAQRSVEQHEFATLGHHDCRAENRKQVVGARSFRKIFIIGESNGIRPSLTTAFHTFKPRGRRSVILRTRLHNSPSYQRSYSDPSFSKVVYQFCLLHPDSNICWRRILAIFLDALLIPLFLLLPPPRRLLTAQSLSHSPTSFSNGGFGSLTQSAPTVSVLPPPSSFSFL